MESNNRNDREQNFLTVLTYTVTICQIDNRICNIVIGPSLHRNLDYNQPAFSSAERVRLGYSRVLNLSI